MASSALLRWLARHYNPNQRGETKILFFFVFYSTASRPSLKIASSFLFVKERKKERKKKRSRKRKRKENFETCSRISALLVGITQVFSYNNANSLR
jgi:hypothetical protein